MDDANLVADIAVPGIPPMTAMANGDITVNVPILATEAPPPLLPAPAPTITTIIAAPQQQPTPSPTSISLATIFSELQSYQQQNNGSLILRTSHPVLARITDALTSAGIESIVAQRWDEQFAHLKLYMAQCHDAAATGDKDANLMPEITHPTLGTWVHEQRDQYRLYEQSNVNSNSTLTLHRYTQLKELNIFKAPTNLWQRKLSELKSFKEIHGHCDVPLNYPKLGFWVFNQRDAYHFEREEMLKERVDALEELGFNWNRWGRNRLKVREDAWDMQFHKLLDFIKEHGHSNISQHDKENERLGKWIKNQRYEYRKYHNKGLGPSRLGRDRIDKLNEIGFQWRLRPERIPWDERFQALLEFKAVHGHCRVPMSVPELGKWAKYQRDQYVLFVRGKKAKITQQKIDKLISVQFEESLEERVALELTTRVEQEDSHMVAQHQHLVQPVQQEEVIAYHQQQNHGEEQHAVEQQPQQDYAQHYHQGDAGQVYCGVPQQQQQQQQQAQQPIHYQHGGVHYA